MGVPDPLGAEGQPFGVVLRLYPFGESLNARLRIPGSGLIHHKPGLHCHLERLRNGGAAKNKSAANTHAPPMANAALRRVGLLAKSPPSGNITLTTAARNEEGYKGLLGEDTRTAECPHGPLQGPFT